MKTESLTHGFLTLMLGTGLAAAQEPVKLGEMPYEVKERGPSHRTWQREVQWQGPNGQLITETNSYVEMHTGMHFWDREWKESQELIEVFPEGAIARHGQTKVIFAPTLDVEGSVDIETPDGQRVRASALALVYFDPISGAEQTLGVIRPSQGELLPPNRIIYPDTFDGLNADIIYTYTKSGLEQDVVLREQPPDPRLFGLSDETRLEVMTEVFEAPEPEKRVRILKREPDPVKRARMAEPDFIDEELRFGDMVIGPGRAFWINPALDDPPEWGKAVEIGKRYIEGDGRRILIESASYQDLKPLFQELPEFGEEQVKALPPKREGREGRQFPEVQYAQNREAKPILVADAGAHTEPGLVIDYVTISGYPQGDYTFRGDTTYYISAQLIIFGTTVIEGGAVLKYESYDHGASFYPRLYARGPFICKTSKYQPAIITVKHDNTVGETISGSTGDPTGHYGHIGLYIYDTGGDVVLENVQIRHCAGALAVKLNDSNLLRNIQIVDCQYGIHFLNSTGQVQNVLISTVTEHYATANALHLDDSTVYGEHLTVYDSPNLYQSVNGSTLYLTNSLLVDVDTIASFTGSDNYTASGYASTFQTVGAGAFYLIEDSPLRNLGSTEISPDLRKVIQERTTHPPVVLTDSIATPTTFAPQAQRDTDIPDIGFHYAPIDWAVGNLPVSHTLTLTNGVVIAAIANKGFLLNSGAKVISEGSPLVMNRLIRHQSVQEQIDPWNLTYAWRYFFASQATTPEIHLRFTEVALVPHFGLAMAHFLSGSLSQWTLRDCQYHNVQLHGIPSSWIPMQVGITNNVFHGCGLSFSQYYTSGLDADFYNNLFVRGSVSLLASQPTSFTWTVKDNVFDNSSVTDNSYSVQNSHNGYINTSVGLSGGSSNVVVSTFNYGEGPLGRFYQVSTDFTDKGSRSASAAGLYHYTTRLSQVKNGLSTNDLGFHYVSMDPKEGLVAHWRLDEGAGTTAADSSGYGHTGSLVNGPTWSNGVSLGALALDGTSNQHLSTSDSSDLEPADITISLWFKAADFAQPTASALVTKRSSTSNGYFLLYMNSTQTLVFDWGGTATRWNTGYTPPLDAWTHIVVTRSSSGRKLYVNGLLVSSTANTGGTAINTTAELRVGLNSFDTAYDFNGLIDDVRIYNRALNAEEAAALASFGPRDSDGDGLADYLEDYNGNGTFDSGSETDWQTYDSPNGLGGGTSLVVFTPLKP